MVTFKTNRFFDKGFNLNLCVVKFKGLEPSGGLDFLE